MNHRKFVVVFVLIIAVGCGAVSKPAAPPGPLAWQDGYLDGCPSGESAAGYVYARWVKNVERSMADELYKQGWADGYDRCKTEMQDTKAIAGRIMRGR